VLGAFILRGLTGGRWKPGRNPFVEALAGEITLVVLLGVVGMTVLLVIVLNRVRGDSRAR
jgi:hypothetical protein